ncbi:MAG: metallophosphoesterase [Nitrospirae bacterium]|nr:metallophosphoesterase [Nitrospirota bacterium]
MKIGIMSDTHDNIDNIAKAVNLFNQRGVEKVIHAGDFTSPFSLKPIDDLKAEFIAIFGNNDGDLLQLRDRSNGRINKQPHKITIDGKKIVILHEHFLIDALADSGHFDIVIYGHTHKAVNEKRGKTLVINPGETGSWLYGKATVAILDLDLMAAEIIPL